MRARAWGMTMVGVVALAAGCGVRRIENGVYHSPKGYRVTLPGADWVVARSSRADLELRHRAEAAGMLVNAVCPRGGSRASPDVLARHLVIGVRARVVIEQGPALLGGREAVYVVLHGRAEGTGTPVRVAAYVVKDDRCVYDLIYAAPPSAFDAWRPVFGRFVETFALER